MLGNPYELVNEEWRDFVNECWRKYLKECLTAYIEFSLLDPMTIHPEAIISAKWKKPTPILIKKELMKLIPKLEDEKVHYLGCWCRKSTETTPVCHCDVTIRCVKYLRGIQLT